MNNPKLLILFSIILLTACGPASAATGAPATETLPPTRQVIILSASPVPEVPSSAELLQYIMSVPGNYFAFVRSTGRQAENGGPETELALFNESGEFIGTLAKNLGEDVRLSPDNMLIAYTVGMSGPLLITNLCTGDTVSLVSPGPFYGLSWNKDGTKLGLAKKDGIYLVSFPAGEIKKVTQCSVLGESPFCWAPEISPDGKFIAYQVDISAPNPDPRSGIYIADTSCLFEGKVCENTVAPILNPPSAYTWAPDSQSIVIADGINVKEYSIPLGERKKDFPHAVTTQQNIKWLRWFTGPEALVAIDLRASGIIKNSTGLKHFKVVTDQPLLGLAGLIVIDKMSKPICGN